MILPTSSASLFLFSVTMFVSALLLFLIQPMIGKTILPRFGGSPTVWVSCMLFFQAALLAGYAYAHALTSRFELRRQVTVHLALLLVPLAAFLLFPVGISEGPDFSAGVHPVLGVLLPVMALVGLPFFVLSTSAPLLQRWFGQTGHPSAGDPYFLYAASNFGSMAALLSYPILVEPFLKLAYQGIFWMAGYGLLVALIVLCGYLTLRAPVPARAGPNGGIARDELSPGQDPDQAPSVSEHITAKPSASEEITRTPRAPVRSGKEKKEAAALALVGEPSFIRKLHWVALAFIPSSMMLGLTTHITTDIAPMPLLWIPPLALYLLSFILVFAESTRKVYSLAVPAMPVFVLFVVFADLVINHASWHLDYRIQFALHLVTLFVVALVCHGELARLRPRPEQLTGFYLCMSLGGVLGGLFNALLVPYLFYSVAEYPLILAASCLLLPEPEKDEQPGLAGWLEITLNAGLVVAGLYVLLQFRNELRTVAAEFSLWHLLTTMPGVKPGLPFALAIVGVPLALLGYVLADRKAIAWRLLDLVLPIALGLLTVRFLNQSPWPRWLPDWIQNQLDLRLHFEVRREQVISTLTCTLLVAIAYGLCRHSVRFALAVGAMLLVAGWQTNQSQVMFRERSFFGIYWVERERSDYNYPEYHRLRHGTTTHGVQRLDSNPQSVAAWLSAAGAANPLEAGTLAAAGWRVAYDRRNEPLSYFHRTGPIGQIFEVLVTRPQDRRPVAVLGLGTGTLAGYALPGQPWTFYEIDPLAIQIATNPEYFRFIDDCRSRGPCEIKLGDGRLKIKEEPAGKFRLLFMDAFTSDAIPVHLITREAIQMYFEKLTPDGAVVVNVANRYLRPGVVLANIAQQLGLAAYRRGDWGDASIQKYASDWVILARKPEHLGPIAAGWSLANPEMEANALLALLRTNAALPLVNLRYQTWEKLEPDPSKPLWTDDFSNLLSILR